MHNNIKQQNNIVKNGGLKIAFFGTPDFAVPILKALCQGDFKPKAVIAAPDRPAGRGQEMALSPIKIIAQKNEISVFQPETRRDLIEQTQKIKPDLIITAAYGKILPKEVLDIPKYGSLNVHPSILPKYRGPSPIQFAILNGDDETGTTIILMNQNLDEGPILAQGILKINKDDTTQTLGQKLSEASATLLIKTLPRWTTLKEMPKSAQNLIVPQPQNHAKATYTKILTKQDGKIIWSKSACEIERQIRAFFPWPGSYAVFKDKTGKSVSLKILSADIQPPPSVLPLSKGKGWVRDEKDLGQVFLTEDPLRPQNEMNKKLAVQTGSGCLIINELQLEGSKSMRAADFLNGHPEIVGMILT